jgi:hypothetical protein
MISVPQLPLTPKIMSGLLQSSSPHYSVRFSLKAPPESNDPALSHSQTSSLFPLLVFGLCLCLGEEDRQHVLCWTVLRLYLYA